MSWDIYVMDLPKEAQSMEEIPPDYVGQPLGKRSEIIQRILEVVPSADFTDPSWGSIETAEYVIEFNMGQDEILNNFSFRVRGDDSVVGVLASILDHLQLRAVDPNSASGFFSPEESVERLRAWRDFRNRVIGQAEL